MKKNMGSADRVLRIVLAAIVGVLFALNIISGTTAIILGILAIVFVVTSFVSFCPLYLPLGISTIKNKD
jgi:hypothetical protein